MAAFSEENGIISPGGVGYDINCLTEDSRITTEFGCFKQIKDFEEAFVTVEKGNLLMKQSVFRLKSLNPLTKNMENKEAVAFIRFKPKNSVLEIKTELGFTIQATEDHPFLTKNGMVELKNLESENEVAVSTFNGVEHEFSDRLIINKIENISEQSLNELKKRNLLSLFENSLVTPYLAKILGYLMGDGIVYFSDGKGYIHAYGKRNDLEKMKEDIEKIGFTASLYERNRKHKIETQYGIREFNSETCELHVSSTSFAKLLVELGMPLGIKTDVDFCVPDWIMNSKRWIKRLFLAGLFGAELSKPKTHSKTGFYSPIFSQNKNNDKGRKFFIQLMHLLEEFDVKTNKISERGEYKNKIGKTKRLRLIISADEDNLLNLWQKIGFEYNEKRRKLSEIASLYILKKKRLTNERKIIAEKTKEYKKKGLKLREVQQLLCSKIANARFIERCYYESAGQRLTLGFISFNDFIMEKEKEIEEFGIIFDRIESKNKIEYEKEVYDFTVDKTHNFIANNFVVSNCGVRIMKTNLTLKDVKPKLKLLIDTLFKNVPAGLGSHGAVSLDHKSFDELMTQGVKWCVDNGYGWKGDIERCENYGALPADASKASEKAKERGYDQLGTLGSGNHFLEVQTVEDIFQPEVAKSFGITEPKQIVVMIHCGSRGFGHQIASEYIRIMDGAVRKYNIQIKDRELVCAPIHSKEGEDYYAAMNCAVNNAFANRQVIMHLARKSFEQVFGRKAEDMEMELIYDVCHNVAKKEEYKIDGKNTKVVVHRKGATRAFAAGHKDNPDVYRKTGHPVIIPGAMGSSSFICVGTEKAEETFFSSCHGAGRLMSRTQALREFSGDKIKQEMEAKGFAVRAKSLPGLAEEATGAYKNVSEVVRATEEAGICKTVVRVHSLATMKG